MERTKISAGQFFIAMFVSRVLVTLNLSAQYTGGENLLDNIISYLLSMMLAAVLALPLWLALRKGGGKSVPELAAEGGWPGKLVPVCYGLYLVLMGGTSLGMFQVFLSDTVNPGFSAGLVTAALLAVALYGAWRGLETVGRCAVCVFAALILGSVLIFAMVAGRFDRDNLEPLFYNGFSQTGRGVLLFLARTTIFADMAVLLPQVKGRKLLGFGGWMAGTAAFVSGAILLIVGCLGRYAYTQNFPVYVLASLTQVTSLQRLDAVFTGIWMMGLIIQLACGLCACRVCVKALGAKGKEPKWALWVLAAGMLGLALLTAGEGSFQGALQNTELLFWCTVGTGALLPLAALAFGMMGKKNRR